jgi:hypothetical protein
MQYPEKHVHCVDNENDNMDTCNFDKGLYGCLPDILSLTLLSALLFLSLGSLLQSPIDL